MKDIFRRFLGEPVTTEAAEEQSFLSAVAKINSSWQPADLAELQAISQEQTNLFAEIDGHNSRVSREELVDSLLALPDADARKVLWQKIQEAKRMIKDWQKNPRVSPTIEEIKTFVSKVEIPGSLIHRALQPVNQAADNQMELAIKQYRHTVLKGLDTVDLFLTELEENESGHHLNEEQARRLEVRAVAGFFQAVKESLPRFPEVLSHLEGSLFDRVDQRKLVSFPEVVSNLSLMAAVFSPGFMASDSHFTSSAQTCSLVLDKFYLGNALDNLFENTTKYSGRARPNVFIWTGISQEHQVRIIFADTGQGFSPEMLDFKDGVQRALLEGETTGSTGLGLWLINSYFAGLGGTVKLLNGSQIKERKVGAITVVDFPILENR